MATIHQKLLTAEEFAALPRDGLRTELIRGELVSMPAAFTDHGETAMRLGIIVGHFVLTQHLGKTFAAETGFLVARNPDTVRAPDFAFIQASHVTPAASSVGWGLVMPDLVAEVVSSSDRVSEISQKVQMWLAAGVQLVWVLYPQVQLITVYAAGQPESTLDINATLDGGTVLPGFSTPVSAIFTDIP